MTTEFKDYFSRQADIYVRARPTYPAEMFAFLTSVSPGTNLAWDCATGSGQAAISLAEHFDEVVATDASTQQIEHALSHPKIRYRVALAEESTLAEESVDLITVANGIHWFERKKYYEEVHRVLKPQGVIAVWTCSASRVDPGVDAVTKRLSAEILRDFWPKENALVWSEYRDLAFPFEEVPAPTFHCRQHWELVELEEYLLSWSSSQRYTDSKGSNPVALVRDDLQAAWGNNEKRDVHWEIHLRLGRKR